jgi:hypothetical protein
MLGSLRRSRNISTLRVNTYRPPLPVQEPYLVRGLLLQFRKDVLRLGLGRERHVEDGVEMQSRLVE